MLQWFHHFWTVFLPCVLPVSRYSSRSLSRCFKATLTYRKKWCSLTVVRLLKMMLQKYRVQCWSRFYLSFLNSALKYWLESGIKRHLKRKGWGFAALVWPPAAVKACLEVMHTKSWCSSCYLWIAWSHLESKSQERYFSSSVGRGYISTSNICLNMNIFPLNHFGLTVITSICITFFFFLIPEPPLSPNTLEIWNSTGVCVCVFEETFKWLFKLYVLSEQEAPQIWSITDSFMGQTIEQ